MRNYTSKSQKVEMYSKKYNLAEEEVYRILTEHEALLTKEELAIKYDNSHIGELPQWLIDEGGYEALQECIDKGIKSKFDFRWGTWTTIEDLNSYMWEFILKRIHLYNTKAHIVTAVKNRMVWLYREHAGRGVYIGVSFQDSYGRNDEGNTCTYGDIVPDDTETLDEEALHIQQFISNVPDEKTRSLLTAVGYLILNVEGLKEDFYNILETTTDEEVKENLRQLTKLAIQRVTEEELIKEEKLEKKPVKLFIKDIIKAMKYNINTINCIDYNNNDEEYTITDKMTVKDSINELKDYIVNLGLATYPIKRKSDGKRGRKFSFYDKNKKPEEPIAVTECITTNILNRPDLMEKYPDIYKRRVEEYNKGLPMIVAN